MGKVRFFPFSPLSMRTGFENRRGFNHSSVFLFGLGTPSSDRKYLLLQHRIRAVRCKPSSSFLHTFGSR